MDRKTMILMLDTFCQSITECEDCSLSEHDCCHLEYKTDNELESLMEAAGLLNPKPDKKAGGSITIDVSLNMSEAENQIREFIKNPISETIKIKYFDPDIERILKVPKGDWIDLRAAEDVVLKAGEYKSIRLGVGMILPEGYEAHVVPRSSTFKNFGLIQTNSVGVIDNSYSGDNDEWHFPALAMRNTTIKKGDRICQFRIVRNQPPIKFEPVKRLGVLSRGGIGSTGKR